MSAFGADYDRAQRQYDAQLPAEDHTDDDGHCLHKWRRLPGVASDGTKFAKCVWCGVEEEVA
jgi:hypothetical protein